MQILVACEESQAVTIALRKLGHEAYSCDLIPCSGGHPEWHIQQDVLPLLNGYCFFKTCDGSAHYVLGRWDMLIERGLPLDEVVFYDTGMEFQAIYDLRDAMLPIFQQHGIKYTTLYPDNPFLYDMLERPVKGRERRGYGWCGGLCRWGTTRNIATLPDISGWRAPSGSMTSWTVFPAGAAATKTSRSSETSAGISRSIGKS